LAVAKFNAKARVDNKILKRLQNTLKKGFTAFPKEAVNLIRIGDSSGREGSVLWQFENQTWFTGNTRRKWKQTKNFGTYAPRSTMNRTGSYFLAWIGRGPGAVSRVTPKRVVVGVNKARFPQVHLHQASTARTVKPRRRVNGQWVMRLFLGMEYGVWLSNARVGRGFRIPPRRIGANNAMEKRLAKKLEKKAVESLKG
jgi:hypothetical protein